MGDVTNVDVVRWTFSIEPDRREVIEEYLLDLGLDVSVRDGCRFIVLWDEPAADSDFEMVVENLWTLNEAPFEITHEAFGRLDLLVFHPESEEPEQNDPTIAAA